MATVTHSIYMSDLKCEIDLYKLVFATSNIIYRETPFKVCIWRLRGLNSTCMVYHTGVILVHGSKKSLRQYARVLQKIGFSVHLKKISLVTKSMVYTMSKPLEYKDVVKYFDGEYNPEIFHGVIFKKKKVNFTVYNSGKVIITGIRGEKMIDEIVNPVIRDLETCV